MKTDAPIKLEKHDLLQRYPFAQGLIKGLITTFENGQESIVIGLNGEWGSGKTSLMEFLKSEINIQTETEQGRNCIFDFNTWRILNQNDLQVEFLKGLGAILGSYSQTSIELKQDFKMLSNLAEKVNKCNPEPASKVGISFIAGVIKLLTKETNLIDLKREADLRLEGNNIKLFIFIDDIDRLPPKEIIEVFQLIKLNANFKNTYFIVAFDKSIVINALKKEYGEKGEKYLEKIVQIDYTIPAITNDVISRIFFEEITKIINDLNINIDFDLIREIWNSYLKNYFSTIRHIYRFCNAFELRLPTIYNEINFIDFMLIEVIRIFDYNSYEWVLST